MSKFLDIHPMNCFEEEVLRKAQYAPKAEFSVITGNLLDSIEAADKLYCLLYASTRESGEKTLWAQKVN